MGIHKAQPCFTTERNAERHECRKLRDQIMMEYDKVRAQKNLSWNKLTIILPIITLMIHWSTAAASIAIPWNHKRSILCRWWQCLMARAYNHCSRTIESVLLFHWYRTLSATHCQLQRYDLQQMPATQHTWPFTAATTTTTTTYCVYFLLNLHICLELSIQQCTNSTDVINRSNSHKHAQHNFQHNTIFHVLFNIKWC